MSQHPDLLRPTRPQPDEAQPLALVCRGLVKRFGSLTVVREVDFDVPAGSFSALLGPSGCGKTTMLRLIAGFERVDAGTIELNGRLISGPSRHEPPERRRVGMVFQEGALFGHLDVAANVGFGLNRSNNRETVIAETLRMVGLTGYERRMPHELSGGHSSASPSPGPSRPAPRSCCWTSPSPPSMRSSAPRSGSKSAPCSARSARPPSSSRTTRRRRSASPIGSRS